MEKYIKKDKFYTNQNEIEDFIAIKSYMESKNIRKCINIEKLNKE